MTEALPARAGPLVVQERVPRHARFKELLAAEGCLDKWYTFEAESTERALRNWCKENDIQLVERADEPTS